MMALGYFLPYSLAPSLFYPHWQVSAFCYRRERSWDSLSKWRRQGHPGQSKDDQSEQEKKRLELSVLSLHPILYPNGVNWAIQDNPRMISLNKRKNGFDWVYLVYILFSIQMASTGPSRTIQGWSVWTKEETALTESTESTSYSLSKWHQQGHPGQSKDDQSEQKKKQLWLSLLSLHPILYPNGINRAIQDDPRMISSICTRGAFQ
jgi:hypothetical protein